jgi:hypothetical protein
MTKHAGAVTVYFTLRALRARRPVFSSKNLHTQMIAAMQPIYSIQIEADTAGE